MHYLRQSIEAFVSSNLTDTYADYSDATTYTFETDNTALTNASVVRYGNYYYRSLVTDNIGFDPLEYENIKWVKWGVSNKYAMIDLASNTNSVSSTDIIVEFNRGVSDTITFGYFKASEIVVENLDPIGTVLNTATYVFGVNDEVYDYFDYMYAPYSYAVDRALKTDILPLGDTIRVTIKPNLDDTAEIGFLVAGESRSMGDTLYGVNFSFNSFAVKDTDAFGTLRITKRNVQDLVDFETSINSKDIPTLKRQLKNIYNDIVVFVLDESDDSDLENLLTLGVVENASVVLSNPVTSVMSWSVIESI